MQNYRETWASSPLSTSSTIYVTAVDQPVDAGEGDDTVILQAISSGLANVTIDGGAGQDTFDASQVFAGFGTMFFTDTSVNGQPGFTVGDFDVTGFEVIYGNSSGNNWFLFQGLGAVTVHGGAGSDWFAASFGPIGTWSADVFYGYGGDDQFDVRPLDQAFGGSGNDTFSLYATAGDLRGSLADGGDGEDTLKLWFGWTVDLELGFADTPFSGSDDVYAVSNIENVIVFAWGGYFSSVIGDDNANNFSVDQGYNDGSVGVSFSGGGGNDIIAGSRAGDVLDGGEGIDLVSYRHSLLGVEIDITSGRATGGDAAGDILRDFENIEGSTQNDRLTGNAEANSLFGLDGNDRLSGGGGNDVLDGGLGSDFMLGGAGNDIYIVDAAGDRVFETTTTASTDNAGGIDTVLSAVSFSLDASAGVRFVERLTLTGTANLNGTGNALANILTGNTGNNVLNGGLGNDTLLGGAGNDTYIVDAAGDRVFETTTTTSTENAGGIDTVRSAVSFNLDVSAGVRFVERLTLTGTANLNGTGNALANVLTGNTGNNILNGGLGNDIMLGGAGNDTYVVDAAGDRVFETTTTASTENAGGIDTVRSAVSFNLDASAGVRFVERLTLTGTADLNGTGNALANILTGNTGGNALNGGLGNDILLGGAGNDTFVFNTALSAANVDRISDFNVDEDMIRLENAVFTGLASGTLSVSAFAMNLTGLATDALDRIIYETDTGRLYFDADGNGVGARVQFATLAANLALTNEAFFVF